MIYTPRTCIIPAAAVPSPVVRLKEKVIKGEREREREKRCQWAVALQAPLPAEVQSNFNGNCRHFMRCEMILLHHYVQRRQKKETLALSLSPCLPLSLLLTHACSPQSTVTLLTAFVAASLSLFVAQNHNCCCCCCSWLCNSVACRHLIMAT